jgi:hypothetical protein
MELDKQKKAAPETRNGLIKLNQQLIMKTVFRYLKAGCRCF